MPVIRETTPSETELEQAFNVYFKDIDRCLGAGAYWALLHVVVSLPDVCAALEAPDGETSEGRYRAWCRSYCTRWDWMTDDDYWEMRNRMLHQGRTVGTTAQGRQRRYYKFLTAGPESGAAHLDPSTLGGEVAVFTATEFVTAMVESVRKWFAALQLPTAQGLRTNVARNLPSLVTVQQQELLLPDVGPLTTTVILTSTSTG